MIVSLWTASAAQRSVLDGVSPRRAAAFVRECYDPRTVETPWQRRYVRRFPTA